MRVRFRLQFSLRCANGAEGAQRPKRSQHGEERIRLGGPLVRIADSEWTYGPAQCQIADIARIKIPTGYKFIGESGVRVRIESRGKPPDNAFLAATLAEGRKLGVVAAS